MVEDVLVHVKGNIVAVTLPVLILVVVEDVLVLMMLFCTAKCHAGLNPCCGGRCSSTFLSFYI